MDFFLGSLFTVVIFIAIFLSYNLGQSKHRPEQNPTVKKEEVNEEERKKAIRIRHGFEQLMSYDVSTALNGKKSQ